MNKAIRCLIVAMGLAVSATAIARSLTFAWIPVVMSLPAGDPNAGYVNTQTVYELRTKLNSESWVSIITGQGISQLTRTITLIPNDSLVVQIRAIAGASWVCDRTSTPDCDKSAWATFDSLPTVDTAIIYPVTPIQPIISQVPQIPSSIDLTAPANGADTTLAAGSAVQSGNQWVVTARGADIWGTADAGYFAYTQKTGDFTIIARVDQIQRPAPDVWAKAGVMIRNTLATNSRNVYLAITEGNGVSFQTRTTNGATTTSSQQPGTEPRYLKLQRTGNVFTASHSLDSSSWSTFTTSTVTMGTTVYVGIASTSHQASTPFTSRYDSITISP